MKVCWLLSRLPLLLALLPTLSAAQTPAATQAATTHSAACQAAPLTPLLGPSLQLEDLSEVSAEHWPTDLPSLGEPASSTALHFCRIKAIASAGDDSLIHLELWLPATPAWNGKLVGTGNGGYNPALSYNDMLLALQRGYAVVGGDTGHQTQNAGDVRFGRGHPAKIRDWAERSIHVITVAAKRMIEALTQQAPSRAYYYGCSTGGHQAMAEIQRYPADYDGVIAGAPANNRIRMNASSLWLYQANHTPADSAAVVTPAAAVLVRDRVLEKCDALDGRSDKVLEDPRQCSSVHVDLAGLACKAGQAEQCLSSAQLSALDKLQQGLRDPATGAQLYPGLLPGSEDGWSGFLSNNPPRGDFWRYWVNDSDDFDVWQFDFMANIRKADQVLGSVVDSVNPDLSTFRNRGGKLIVYHGWADAVVSPVDSIAYYNKVKSQLGSQQAMDEFYKLFVVPGMGHCGGGYGATVFGNASQQAPQPTRDNDLLTALDNWVERGHNPAQLHSVELRDGQVASTRLLCAWPAQGGPEQQSCQAGSETSATK
jgi:feruloyl esterase